MRACIANPPPRSNIAIISERSPRTTPQEMDTEKAARLMTEAMAAAGLDPALIYAYRQTGMLVSEDTYESLPPELREEWDAAITEYNEMTTGEPS